MREIKKIETKDIMFFVVVFVLAMFLFCSAYYRAERQECGSGKIHITNKK